MTDNTADMGHFRQRLMDLLAELDALEAESADAAKPVELDQTRVGRLSRMDALGAQAMSQASRQRRQVLRQGAHAALRRIENDDFGFCAECGEEIDSRRLDFDPTVTLCIGCASSREQ